MELKTVSLKDIYPYEKNPRKNDNAVEAVAESIRQCGYVAPIIVDEDMVILAGHTRYKALQSLGEEQIKVLIQSGLTEEQKKKYRILDNKTGELAYWDFDLLGEELKDLDFGDFDFGLSFAKEDIDDFFTDDAPPKKEKESIPKVIEITCPCCGEKFEYEVEE